MKKLIKSPLFYANILLLVILFLFVTSLNVNNSKLPSFVKKAIAAVQSITGQGATNQLAAFSGANTIGNSIIYDTGSAIGIGTTNPLGILHVVSNSTNFMGISNSSATVAAILDSNGNITGSGVVTATDVCLFSGKCLSNVSGPTAPSGVTQITAGSGITISPAGGTGNVTISSAGWSFGGIYMVSSRGDKGDTPNPITGRLTCPSGYNDSVLQNVTDDGKFWHYVHMCWK